MENGFPEKPQQKMFHENFVLKNTKSAFFALLTETRETGSETSNKLFLTHFSSVDITRDRGSWGIGGHSPPMLDKDVHQGASGALDFFQTTST